MAKALHSGGGRTHVEVGVRTGTNSRDRVHVGKASRIGTVEVMARGHTPSPLLTHIAPMPGAVHGNDLAANAVAGPGGSRTVRPSGGQAPQGGHK
jgi:hypothetical protein